MGENNKKTKTKAAMLNELESIKGLLLEEDDIPILQEVIEQKAASSHNLERSKPLHAHGENVPSKLMMETKTAFEEQQDFFSSLVTNDVDKNHTDISDDEWSDALDELNEHVADIAANKLHRDALKSSSLRPSLAKATGENPFLPEHIRARLHGNNPPPLFANETARKISTSSAPSRQLGNTFSVTGGASSTSNHQQDIIDSIVDKMMPEIEKELRSRLEIMSKNLLNELNK